MKNHENQLNLQKKQHNFQSVITLLLLFIATIYFLHNKDNIFMVHLGKLKWPFDELLVAMVTCKMCLVGKLLSRAYLHSWHSANIWNVFVKNVLIFFFLGIYGKFDF